MHDGEGPVAAMAAPASRRSGRQLPDAMQLTALGSVLCLYRHDMSALAPGHAAVQAHVHARVDARGACEWLGFRDADPRPTGCADDRAGRRDEDEERLRLYLLPDTDFLAWERMTAALPVVPERPREATSRSLHLRLLGRMTARCPAARWQAMALRLITRPEIAGPHLVAIPAALSPLGRRVADRIARDEGATPLCESTHAFRAASCNHPHLENPHLAPFIHPTL